MSNQLTTHPKPPTTDVVRSGRGAPDPHDQPTCRIGTLRTGYAHTPPHNKARQQQCRTNRIPNSEPLSGCCN